MRTLLAIIWRYALGTAFTLTPFTAILVVGWTQRVTARSVARRWHATAGDAGDFVEFARAEQATASLARWPRWVMADNARELFAQARTAGPLGALTLVLRALFGSLWLNATLGIRALIPILIVALPAGFLFLFSWWAGWDNSFNKGYEQSWIGPVVAFTGIAYFVVAMTLLPLAEVRQAVNNSWRAFFDIAFLRRAAREVRFGLIGLAAAFVTAGFVVAVLRVLPLSIGNNATTPEDAVQFAGVYTLLVAAALFPLYVGLRLAAARVYARATTKLAAKTGVADFANRERQLMERLSLDGAATPARGNLAKFVTGSGSLLAGALASAVMLTAWFGLVTEIYVSQFLVHDWMHWINHPLIQLPWSGSIFWPP